MKSKFVVIACALIIFSLISTGYNNHRTVTITPRETTASTALNMPSEKAETAASAAASSTTTLTSIPEKTEIGTLYITNTNTKRFHYPHCPSVQQIKESNKGEFTGTKEELIAAGYIPCGNCKP